MQEENKQQETGQQGINAQRRKILWTVLMALSLLVVLVCGIILGRHYLGQRAAGKVYKDLKEDYVKKEPENEQESEEQKEEEDTGLRDDLLVVDFESLWELNPDVYAWLEIPGTIISYPVLQHATDDAYYLNHTIDYREGRPGAIYSERYNETDFSEFIHILYGHNMRNGSMFADLHKYEDQEFLNENSEIYIYTPDRIFVYQIFAAVVTGDRHIMYLYDFSSEAGKQQYLDDLYKKTDSRNRYLEGVEVTTEDKILTLSTCVYGEKDRRYLVNGVLKEVIEVEEK